MVELAANAREQRPHGREVERSEAIAAHGATPQCRTGTLAPLPQADERVALERDPALLGTRGPSAPPPVIDDAASKNGLPRYVIDSDQDRMISTPAANWVRNLAKKPFQPEAGQPAH